MTKIVRTILPDTGEPLIYDLDRRCVVREVTDYCIYLLHKENLDTGTVAQTSGHLVKLWTFLSTTGVPLDDVTDEVLKSWRDAELGLVQANKISRRSDRAARNTVNQKIGAALKWLLWLQDEGVCGYDTIGPANCRVTAGPHREVKEGHKWSYGHGVSSRLFLDHAGAGESAVSVEEATYDAVRERIVEVSHSSYIARRDALFLDVAKTAGFRRGSICSLRTTQFDRGTLEKCRSLTTPLKPFVQKLSYEHSFEVDLTLALRICDFIDGPRKELLERLEIGERQALQAIFLSEKTGRPITGRAMTKSISRSMRAVGAQKGQAIHVFRGLFANISIDAEQQARVECNMDTSTASVSHAVSTAMGHRDPNSLFTYTANHQSRLARRRLARKKQGLSDAQDK